MKTPIVASGLVILALGCASAPLPAARMASAQAAIRAADEVGAGQNPAAALHVRLAREQYARADTLARSGKTELAERMLQRAEADAELAVALARQTASEADASRATNDLHSTEGQRP